ncbi:MAG TPA: SLC13 family permease [Methanocorpusculum sp.]|nr:SLC13 family permease [Methanocorpusculum sp.]
MVPLAVWILVVVFWLIVVRRIGKVRLPIWAIMTGGAFIALLFGTISIPDAFFSINFDVILFLLGMFVLGAALEKSGLLEHLSLKGFARAQTKKAVLFWFILLMAAFSALLMNDTVAIIGTTVALFCAARYTIPVKTMLFALCFAVTFGSSMTPIGNPQNLLIAISSGMQFAFLEFALYLLVPSLVCLYILYRILLFTIPDPDSAVVQELKPTIFDETLARWSKISLGLVFFSIALRILLPFFGFEMPFVIIAAVAALPLLLFSKRRLELLRGVDWSTLLFFASMFVLMGAVWNSGFIQIFLPSFELTSIPALFVSTVIVSQFISNVPFVALILPVLSGSGVPLYMALVAGCTAAGSLTIIGAASSVIILQHAEKSGETFSFMQFFKIGLPMTLIAGLVYIGWIMGIGFLFA